MKTKLLTTLFFLSTLIGVQRVSAQHQNALDFDGIDDEVIVGGGSALIANSSAISMSCWVYPTNTTPVFPNYDGFAGIRNNTDADFYLVEFGVNRLEARFRNSAGINFDIVDTAMPVNVWVHYTFTFSGSELTLYRNGTIVNSIPANGTITNAGEDFYIGNMYYNGASFLLTGKIDEVALWSRVLNPNEVDCIYHESVNPSDIALKLYFDCNQGIADSNNTAITTLTDVSGHIDGTMNLFSLTGSTSNFVAGINNFSTVADVICPGTTYSYAGQNFTAPGTYLLRFPITSVCDSIVNLELTGIDTTVAESGGVLTANQSGGTYEWVECLNHTVVPGETGQSFYSQVNGTFAAVISVNGCTDTSECHTVIFNGITQQYNFPIQLSKNPFTEKLTIINSTKLINGIRVVDIQGRVIYTLMNVENKTVEINSSEWMSGVYFISCYTDKSVVTMKAIKQ